MTSETICKTNIWKDQITKQSFCRKLWQATVAPEQTGSDQLLALPCNLAGVTPQSYSKRLSCALLIIKTFRIHMYTILLLQAPLVALTRSLGEVTSHAEASLAALQVVFQVNIFLAAVFKFLGVFVTHICTLLGKG